MSHHITLKSYYVARNFTNTLLVEYGRDTKLVTKERTDVRTD